MNYDQIFWEMLAAIPHGADLVRSMDEWEVAYLTAKFEIEYECGRYTKDFGYGVDEAGNGFFRDKW
jgi:hypothetical protein